MKKPLAIVIAALGLSLASRASADDAADAVVTAVPASVQPQAPPRNALSLQLLSLLNNGVTVQYERQVARRVSIATSLGHRWSGGNSVDVSETGFGAEGRLWLMGRAPWQRRWDAPAMVGPFLSLRTDLGLTQVADSDRVLGSSMRIAESVALGGRVAIAERFELTTSIGCGLRHEVDPRGRLASWTRFEPLRFGLTFGVLF